jgi:hypothetical protein
VVAGAGSKEGIKKVWWLWQNSTQPHCLTPQADKSNWKGYQTSPFLLMYYYRDRDQARLPRRCSGSATATMLFEASWGKERELVSCPHRVGACNAWSGWARVAARPLTSRRAARGQRLPLGFARGGLLRVTAAGALVRRRAPGRSRPLVPARQTPCASRQTSAADRALRLG